jgi:hypothetical protein
VPANAITQNAMTFRIAVPLPIYGPADAGR